MLASSSPLILSLSNRDSLHVFQGPSGSSLTSSLCRLLRQTQRHHPPLCCYHSSMKRGTATQNSHTLSLLISRCLCYMSSSHPITWHQGPAILALSLKLLESPTPPRVRHFPRLSRPHLGSDQNACSSLLSGRLPPPPSLPEDHSQCGASRGSCGAQRQPQSLL